jgi:hypothetical protein
MWKDSLVWFKDFVEKGLRERKPVPLAGQCDTSHCCISKAVSGGNVLENEITQFLLIYRKRTLLVP